jgi:hypothetical protein
VQYEVEPGVVASRDPRTAVRAVMLLAGAVVALAVGGAALGSVTPPSTADQREARLPGESLEAAGLETAPPAARVGAPDRSLPHDVVCHDLDRTTCLRIARAALHALTSEAPAVTSVAAWASLLCNDNFDCPPGYLDHGNPLGSAVLGFADDGSRAAFNVVSWRYLANARLGARAWLVDWLPPD